QDIKVFLERTVHHYMKPGLFSLISPLMFVIVLYLKAKVEQLTAELQVYNELKRRVEQSTFKKDLQRNIQVALNTAGVKYFLEILHIGHYENPFVQEHGSPGAFWESEQESLLFVIEMKAERVQEQSRKLRQMDDLVGAMGYMKSLKLLKISLKMSFSYVQVEKNLSLEDQIVYNLQQNEDLKVRIDNCQALIQ
ncbi:hypothetical protein XENOCAPTIV_024436, partial [Xenoophorus captivus]